MEGTITWYDVTKHLPPINPDLKGSLSKPSIKVLVYGPGGWPQLTYYSYAARAWYAADEMPFTITHFAYINYPTT